MSWLGRISQNRTRVHGQQQAERPAAAKANPEQFAQTLISDKVLKRHGAALAPAAGDMQAIAGTIQTLPEHQAVKFANAVDQFYSALGRSTDHLEGDRKQAVVTASMTAMRGLVQDLAQHPVLLPAMAALSSMLEPRGKPDVDPRAHAEAAKKEVLSLVEQFEGRLGAHSALFGFRNLVEGYEAGQDGLKLSDRPKVWDTVREYLNTVVPRSGCDQGQLGTITGLFMKALRETPNDPKKALATATKAALAPLADTRAAALQQLEVVPPNIQPNTPQRKAFDAMQGALRQVIENNPAGPEALIQAVEQLQGKLNLTAQAANDDLANGYKNLARMISIAGDTSAALPVLMHIAQNLPTIVTHANSRNILAKGARLQKGESMAPLLVEAQLARLNKNPQQLKLVDALEKLKRLPPGPALKAAVALLPQAQQAHAPQLAEALFVESRVAPTQDALNEFTTRFSAAFPQLRNLGEDAGPTATALAKSGTGALNAQQAKQLYTLITQVKAALPQTPVAKLLGPGRDGEPGLMELSNVKDFLHNPQPMLTELFKTIQQRRPNQDSTAEARVAMRIAAEVGRFDRNPQQTDFPTIKADFDFALTNPDKLTSPDAPGIKGAPSMASFAADHPEFPIEVLFTAARHFDRPRMGWVADQLQSTRSHAYKRVLRDAIFAAIKTKHAYFFKVLANSPAERAAKEGAATAIAMDHRQGHAANSAWDELIDGLEAGEDPVARLEAEQAAEAMRAIGLDDVANVDPEGMKYITRGKKQLQALMNFFAKDQYSKPAAFFMEPLMAAVKAQADGSWPAAKYESDIAKEHLAPLRPEQLEAWKQNMVTSGAAGAPVPVDDPEKIEALQLLQGVAKTLTANVRIGGKGFENVKWDAASLESLSKKKDALLGQLRNAKKGTPEHRKLSGEIGPISDRVALLALHAGLVAHFGPEGAPAADGQAALTDLKGLALAALGPLRKQRASGFVQALETAAFAVKDAAPATPRSGNYACDDDTLDAYLTAFGGGCIHPENGFNRGSLVELIAGSQYKMIRAMRDDKPVGRSFLRLVRVEMPNGYKGMALRMDPPQASSGGSPGNVEKQNMYKHALRKAMAMKVPLLVSDATVQPAVQEMGLKLENLQSTVYVHKGVTGMHHNQGMFSGDYFICWPGIKVGQGGPRPKDADKECQRRYSFQTVMPPDWQANQA